MPTPLCRIINPNGEGFIPLTIVSKTHSSNDELHGNIRANIKRDVTRFLALPNLLHGRLQPIAICGGGPSLPDYFDEIKKFPQVMTCGSAHDVVVQNGILPSFALIADAKQRHAGEFKEVNDFTSYLVASQCHPDMFDMLEGRKVAMWHFAGQIDNAIEEERNLLAGEPLYGGNGPAIGWGCMTGVLGPQFAMYLGFQEMHFFGFDGSVIDGEHHCYHVPEDREVRERYMDFELNGRTFVSTTGFMSQIEHLFDFFYGPDGQYVKGTVYGDGLWPWIIRQSDEALWPRLKAA
jgi:hypothetical protein